MGFSADTPWLTVDRVDDALGKTGLSNGDKLAVKLFLIDRGALPRLAQY
jgi:hypothetical protein